MKKLITSLFALLAISISLQAQIAWNQIKVSTTETPGADTVYFNMINRSTGNVIGVIPTDSLNSIAGNAAYSVGDSVVWRIVKGASLGTAPRIRLINLKTGKYLYSGTKGGTTKRPYLSDRNDPFNGVKDFTLVDKGPRVAAEYYYNIVDYQGSIINNLVAGGTIGLGASSSTGDAKHMFRFNKKSGPQPKAELLPRPALELSATEPTLGAGGSVTLVAKVTKGTNDLLGTTTLFYGNTVIDTLDLDANGSASFVYSGLKYGTEKFAVVYSGCVNYEPNDSVLAVTVGPNPAAKATKVELLLPSTSEAHKNVTLSITSKTQTDDVIPQGKVNVFVNGILKNTLTPDVLGMNTITFPNLLVGTVNISAVYVGDKMAYLDSDTTKVTIDITPTSASAKAYPVYFDLADQHEISLWNRYNVTATTARPHSKTFTTDSLPGIVVSDTINPTFKVSYNALGATYDKLDNAYNRADNINVPLGANRPRFVRFKTPWLNEGSYNVYLSHRISSGGPIYITSATMDNNTLYFPEGEMVDRILNSYNYNSNHRRQWNAKGHSNNMAMNYLGSVNLNNSNIHTLQINVDATSGGVIPMDMLQFIPVDMDSISINTSATVGFAKKYYPMFDWVGFARQPGYDVAAVPATYADFTNFAIPYQVADMTDWGTKYSYTIDSIGLTKKVIGTDEYVANYVTIYRAEDKWTRVAEGYGNTTTFDFTGELPKGDYYYETINYTDLGDGAQDYRTFISSGTFSVGPNAVDNFKSSKIKAFASNRTLTITGIDAGARILVVDLTGRVLVNETAKSNLFTKQLSQGAYVVKVVSGETLRTKVIVK